MKTPPIQNAFERAVPRGIATAPAKLPPPKKRNGQEICLKGSDPKCRARVLNVAGQLQASLDRSSQLPMEPAGYALSTKQVVLKAGASI